jgi:hypothetical protein
MALNVDAAIGYTWTGLGIVWLIGLAFTKRTVRAQPDLTRQFQMAVPGRRRPPRNFHGCMRERDLQDWLRWFFIF